MSNNFIINFNKQIHNRYELFCTTDYLIDIFFGRDQSYLINYYMLRSLFFLFILPILPLSLTFYHHNHLYLHVLHHKLMLFYCSVQNSSMLVFVSQLYLFYDDHCYIIASSCFILLRNSIRNR